MKLLAMLVAAIAALFALAASPASAKQVHVFSESFGTPCTIGPCALGQLSEPSAVAVNEESGDVYVVDKGNSRVQIFDSAGTATGQFNGAAAPTGAFSEPTWIAIDNDPASESFEDVYVSDNGHSAIDKFESDGTYLGQITEGEGGAPLGEIYGLATDPEGRLWVYEKTLEEGKIDDYTSAEPNAFIAARGMNGRGPTPGLAVDSEDNFYANTAHGLFAKFDSAGNELFFEVGIGPPEESSAGAADPADDNFYADQHTFVKRFNSNAEGLDTFGAGYLTEGAGLAVFSESPEKLLYVADKGAGEVRVFKEVTIPDVTTEAATEVKAHSAILNGSLTAAGGEAHCKFLWGTTEALEETPIPCEAPIAAGETEAVSVTLPTQPNTTYFFRLEAENANGLNEGAPSETKEFTTPGPASIEATFATEVSADSAILGAQIQLHGVPTTYRFEYGTTIAYGTTVPVPDESLGSGKGEVSVSQSIQGLEPDTTYHYRVRTEAEVEPGHFEPTPGPDHTFTTESATSSSALPDGRQWQLVSPPDKHGGVIEPAGKVGTTEAAASGDAITYIANAPITPAAEGYTGTVQALSTRTGSGWGSGSISNAHAGATGQGLASPEYVRFSSDLSSGLFQPWGLFQPSLSAAATEQTPYLRALDACAGDCNTPLVTATNALPGFGEERRCEEENGVILAIEVQCGPFFMGSTEGLDHIVLGSGAPLIEGAGREQMYEWSGGGLSQVSLLPENEAGEELPTPDGSAKLGAGFGQAEGGPVATADATRAKHAISADGSRVFWEAEGKLYMRDTQIGRTIQLDIAEQACLEAIECESGGAFYQIASANGSRVFFTDNRRLTSNSGSGEFKPGGEVTADLYECRIVEAGGPRCELTDLTPRHGGESAQVLGSILGAAEDGSDLYFAADGVLGANLGADGTRASPGDCREGVYEPASSCNLYRLREGAVTFVATLSGGDLTNWANHEEVQPVRISPEGNWLAFMSERPLTGYDNRDAVSGSRDAEIYEYDAQAEKLTCASCDPSGARPHGVQFGSFTKNFAENMVASAPIWEGSGWVAALMPPVSLFQLEESGYQSRALSPSGRLFFNSLDALTPQDSNNQWDVYESEPEGVGNCAAATPGYQVPSGICVGLISAGTSGKQSAFLDASEGGEDVFILTSSRLVSSQDVDAARDVYDAHECSAEVPCFPLAEPPPPACAGDACQQPALPSNFETPGTALLNGPGNLTECPKGKKLHKGKCVKKHKAKKHRKQHKKKSHKRANANQGAGR